MRLAKARRGRERKWEGEEGGQHVHDAYDDLDVDEEDDPEEERQPSSLWGLAKRLATARARRVED